MPLQNKAAYNKYMRQKMKERRAAERQKLKHVNEAIKEFLNDTTIIKTLKQVHDNEGNWNDYKNQPVILLYEELNFILGNETRNIISRLIGTVGVQKLIAGKSIEEIRKSDPKRAEEVKSNIQKIYRFNDVVMKILRDLMRPTLEAKLSAIYEMAFFISDNATTSNQFMTSHVDRLLTEWTYWLKAYAQGSWEGYHNEFEARLKLIDAWRKMWNLEPIERPPQPQPLNREITPAEREAAKKRLRPVLEALEKKKREENEKKKKETQNAPP
jgi:hypothetical protein